MIVQLIEQGQVVIPTMSMIKGNISIGFCHMFSLYLTMQSLVISHFGFEGGILVLIASVPGHCLPFTFQSPLRSSSIFFNDYKECYK